MWLLWPARRDLNPQSSESESDALSNYATGGYSVEHRYYIIDIPFLQAFIFPVLHHSENDGCFHTRRFLIQLSEDLISDNQDTRPVDWLSTPEPEITFSISFPSAAVTILSPFMFAASIPAAVSELTLII